VPVAFRRKIVEFLKTNPGLICSPCIAKALTLPLEHVAMTTLGLDNRAGFAMEAHGHCSRCGTRGRVIRAAMEETT
jgi:hypothetical protein